MYTELTCLKHAITYLVMGRSSLILTLFMYPPVTAPYLREEL